MSSQFLGSEQEVVITHRRKTANGGLRNMVLTLEWRKIRENHSQLLLAAFSNWCGLTLVKAVYPEGHITCQGSKSLPLVPRKMD